MKIIARAVQASFTVLADDGTEIMALSYDNASFSCDLATGLKAFSELAHQFKALDATHNAGVVVNEQGERGAPQRVDRLLTAFNELDSAVIDENIKLTARVEERMNDARLAVRQLPSVVRRDDLHEVQHLLSIISGHLRSGAYRSKRVMNALDALSDVRVDFKSAD